MTVGALPVGWQPPWVGLYAWEVNPTFRSLDNVVPDGVWARWVEPRRGVYELVVPAVVGAAGFEVRGGEAWLRLPAEAVLHGIEVRASALWRGRWVEVVQVEEDCVLVAGDQTTWLVGRGELEQVTMDAYEARALDSRGVLWRTSGLGEPRWLGWRAVLPSADRLVCDALPGSLGPGQWPSPFVGPVPSTWQEFSVMGSTPLLGDRTWDRDGMREGTLYFVEAEGWAPWPDGLGELAYVERASWSTRMLDGRDVEGSVFAGVVTASWRGRRVEVVYVAYAYAYVVDCSGRSGGVSEVRVFEEEPFAGLEGPVRLDELCDISFKVTVTWRRPGSGPWPFLEVWGLDPCLEGEGVAHMDRGGWPAWPWRTS